MWIEKHGQAWRIREQVAGAKATIAGGYPTKTAAKNAKKLLEADRLRGDYMDPRGGKLKLSEWIAVYWPRHAASLKPSAQISEGARVYNHIMPALGHLALDEIRPSVIQQWISDLLAGRRSGCGGRPLAAKTISNVHGLMFGIMAAAVEEKLIRGNPCAKTDLPKRDHVEMRFLTAQEVERLLLALPEYWRPLVLLLVTTGLRWGEAVSLRTSQLDILTGRLTVRQTMHELTGIGIIFTEPKTKGSRRTVTFGKTTASALVPVVAAKQQLAIDQAAGRAVAPAPRKAVLAVASAKDLRELVFTTPSGTPVRTRHFRSRVWQDATKAAGLDGLRIHDLRHTHAAWLIAANVPITGIQRRLGHSSIMVTSDLYGHLLPEVDAGILRAVEGSVGSLDGGLMGEINPEQPGTTEVETEQPAAQTEGNAPEQGT